MAKTKKVTPKSARRVDDDWYTRFVWDDLATDPGWKASSLAARGLWASMWSLMAKGEPYGHLTLGGRPISTKALTNQVGGGASETQVTELLAELEENNVFSRSDDGIIYSRRMVRDRATRARDVANGKLGGNPRLKAPDNGGDKPPVKASVKAQANPSDNHPNNGGDKAIAIVKATEEVVRRSEEISVSQVELSRPETAPPKPAASAAEPDGVNARQPTETIRAFAAPPRPTPHVDDMPDLPSSLDQRHKLARTA